MNSTPANSAILRQLDAALQLLETFSSSLTATDIVAIRGALLGAYTSMGEVLAARNLETEGISFVGESCDCPPSPLLTLVQCR